MQNLEKYFYASQIKWIEDDSPLKIAVKSRQIGFSFANALRLVLQVSAENARLDAYISSRDFLQAKLQLEDCRNWARLFNIGCSEQGEVLLDEQSNSSAYVLQFANGRRIYSLSSNPNALAGKRGHVVLDEFALHPDQRLLYRVAKPVTMWGGQFSIMSTHRGAATLFNQIILRIKSSLATPKSDEGGLAEQVANIPFLFSRGERGRENLITSGPLHTFYNQPSQTMDRFQYWELRILWLLLRGECFRLPVFESSSLAAPKSDVGGSSLPSSPRRL